MFCRRGVLRSFAKFTGKHLCQSIFFNKVAKLRLQVLSSNKHNTLQIFRLLVIMDGCNKCCEINPSGLDLMDHFEGSVSCLRKKFTIKVLSVLRYCIFCSKFLVTQENSSIRKLRQISKFMTSQTG